MKLSKEIIYLVEEFKSIYSNHKPGRIIAEIGPMYSGKTEPIINDFHAVVDIINEEIPNKRIILPIAHADNVIRDGVAITSRKPEGKGYSKRSIPVKFDNWNGLVEDNEEWVKRVLRYLISNYKHGSKSVNADLLFDEPFLFKSEFIECISLVRALGPNIHFASISESFTGEEMPFIDYKKTGKTIYDLLRSLKNSDFIVRHLSRCNECGNYAEFTQRKTDGKPSSYHEPIFVIENSSEARKYKHTYGPACRDDFYVEDHPRLEEILRKPLPFSKPRI